MTGCAEHIVSSDLARDALTEVMNIGAGNALSSLSRLVGGKRMLPSLPECMDSCAAGTLPGTEPHGIVVCIRVTGVIRCTVLVLFDDQSAWALAGELLGRPVDEASFGFEEEGAVVEAVNIISCSFLGALATLFHVVLTPTAPVAMYGRLKDLLADHLDVGCVVLTSRFASASGAISGRLLLLADEEGVGSILQVLGVGTGGAPH